MYPCIEHRYVPLLGTSLFALNDTRLLLVCNYKASLFFFQAFQITEKDQKNQKTKKPDKKRYYLWQLSSRVAFEQSTVYHIHWLGYSLNLGAVFVYLSLSPPSGYASSPYGASIDASCIIEMSQFVY